MQTEIKPLKACSFLVGQSLELFGPKAPNYYKTLRFSDTPQVFKQTEVKTY